MSIRDGVIIVLAIFCVVLFARSKQAIEQRDALKTENQQMHRDLDRLLESYQLTEEAYSALSETQLQIKTKTRTVIKRIQSAPSSDDAPMATVLRVALEAIE